MFSNAANNSSIPVSPEELRRVLTSPEGQKLLTLLRADGGEALKQAAKSVKQGDYDGAKTVLEPMLQNPEAQALLGRLGK